MLGHRVGYIRVSSFDQNPDRQLEGIPLDQVFTDRASGKDVQRPQLAALLAFVRIGDTVVVHSMDRLARNLDDLRQIVQQLTGRGIQIQFIKEQLTFTGEDSPLATLLLSVMGHRSGSAIASSPKCLCRSHNHAPGACRERVGAPDQGPAWQDSVHVLTGTSFCHPAARWGSAAADYAGPYPLSRSASAPP